MNRLRYREFYRRHLPHYQPPGATLFITFRLAGSLPAAVLRELDEETRRRERGLLTIADEKERARQKYRLARYMFARWDDALHSRSSGPFYLRDERVARLVADSLHYRDGRVYTLDAFCLMPNHVHLVCTPLPVGQIANLSHAEQTSHVGQIANLSHGNLSYMPISRIMHSLKRYTARQANRILDRSGPFWQHESYDHVVRDEAELGRIIKYVIQNPVAAGLVEDWQEWRWTYVRDEG